MANYKTNGGWRITESSTIYLITVADCFNGECIILSETDSEITVRFITASACYSSNGQVLGAAFFTTPQIIKISDAVGIVESPAYTKQWTVNDIYKLIKESILWEIDLEMGNY